VCATASLKGYSDDFPESAIPTPGKVPR
jgi:hypothetical protein